MQLRRLGAFLPFVVALAAIASPRAARAQDGDSSGDQTVARKEDKAQKEAEVGKAPEDATTKHVSLDVAGYTDSDHVSVFTPSVTGSIDNVITGAAIRGSYLVDVVSAASVDIVSTASRRWTEARQAGSAEVEYKPHDFGVSIAGSTSSEPD